MSKEKRLSLAVQLADVPTDSMVKRALLCRTGEFDGMFGPVVVDEDRLVALMEKYQAVRAAPANQNDYAPILLDHERKVENVKGRLLPDGLEVKPWKEIDGVTEMGLFGDLRIDDPEARANVESGKYAHLSISYDEDSNEIFEVSFCAVEAARGSIVLSKKEFQGGINMNLEAKLSTLSMKHKALSAVVKASRKNRSVALAALLTKKADLQKEIETLLARSAELTTATKTAQLKARFAEIIRAGKMNPVELKQIDMKELVGLSQAQLKMVFSSYDNRAVSTDVYQFGQTSAEQSLKSKMTPEKMREAIKLQRSGKGATLSEGDEDMGMDEESPEKKKLAEEDKKKMDEMKSFSMGKEEWDKCLEEMTGVHSKLSECVEKMKSMGMDVEKMSAEEKDDEKKEMAAQEEPKHEEEK